MSLMINKIKFYAPVDYQDVFAICIEGAQDEINVITSSEGMVIETANDTFTAGTQQPYLTGGATSFVGEISISDFDLEPYLRADIYSHSAKVYIQTAGSGTHGATFSINGKTLIIKMYSNYLVDSNSYPYNKWDLVNDNSQ